MHKGDIVIADHPNSKSKRLIRSYGIVRDIAKTGNVTIEMADGSMIKRKQNLIAVYVKPPHNWQELFNRQQVVTKSKQSLMFRGSNNRQRRS